jgi:predicted small secreted protein
MKRQVWMILLLVFALLVSGCANNSLAAGPDVTTEPDSVQDKATLLDSLQDAGATVEEGDPLAQPFFTPEGSILKVNGADVQVFEYESRESMEEEASQVMPDGGSIGRSMVAWMDTPHFYKAGKIIVLYVGSDEAVLSLLEKALGPQFAGR